MATPEIFGFEGGYQEGQAAYRQQQLFGLQMQEGAIEIDKGKLDLENARLLQQRQLEFNKRLQQLQNAPQTNPDGSPAGSATNHQTEDMNAVASIAHDFISYGMAAAESGLPKEGAEYIKTGSTLMHQQADVARMQSELNIKKMQHAASLLGNVKSAEDWQAAVMNYEMLYPEDAQEPGLAKIIHGPYNPQTVKAIHDAVLTEMNKSTMSLQHAHQLEADATTLDRKADTTLKKTQTKYTQDRDTNLIKAGAGNLIPKPQQIQVITDAITKDFGGPAEISTPGWKENIRDIAIPITARMLQLTNGGMPVAQARDKAMAEARANGEFANMRPAVKGPGSLGQPRDIPKNPTPAMMQDNNAYRIKDKKTGEEVIGVWNAKNRNFDIISGQDDALEPNPDENETDDDADGDEE